MGGGIQFVPPWGPQLGEAVGQIATGVRDVIDPEAEMRKRIEQTVISNPEFAQQLADMEYQNPGAITRNMRKFFSKDASGLVSSLAPSMQARINRIVRDNADLIGQDPTIAQDIVSRAFTGRTRAQRTVEGAQARAVEEYTDSPDFDADIPEAGASVAFPTMLRTRVQRDINDRRIRDADLRFEMNNALRIALAQGGWQNARDIAAMYASMQQQRDFARFSSDDRSTVNSLMNTINTLQNSYDTPNASDETRNGAIAGINRNIAQVNEILRRYGQAPISATVTPGRGNVMGMQIPGVGRKKIVYTQNGEPIDINQFSNQLMNAVVPGGGSGAVGSTVPVVTPVNPGQAPTVRQGASPTDIKIQGEALKRDPSITDQQMVDAGWSVDDIARARRWAGVPAPIATSAPRQ